jgi:redox-sensitive bicupin YhaK (pirin superfamily)
MITLRLANERQDHQDRWSLDEHRVAPGVRVVRRTRHRAEIITYVREGALGYKDAAGRSGVTQTGEFQHRTATRGARYSETNASRTVAVRSLELSLRSSMERLPTCQEQKRFSVADRRSGLCVIASLDGRRGSHRIHEDAVMFSALLARGQHIVHEVTPGRSAWLHVVAGEVAIGDFVLTAGEGAAVFDQPAVSLTAREAAEIVLLDFGALLARTAANSDGSVTRLVP